MWPRQPLRRLPARLLLDLASPWRETGQAPPVSAHHIDAPAAPTMQSVPLRQVPLLQPGVRPLCEAANGGQLAPV